MDCRVKPGNDNNQFDRVQFAVLQIKPPITQPLRSAELGPVRVKEPE